MKGLESARRKTAVTTRQALAHTERAALVSEASQSESCDIGAAAQHIIPLGARPRETPARSILLCAAVALLSIASAGSAEELKKTSHDSTGFYVGIATGEYIPIEKWPSSYTLGGGGNLIGGYQFTAHWALQLDVSQWLLSGSGLDTWDMKVIPEVKADVGPWKVKPFILAGAGVDYQMNEPQRPSSATGVLTLAVGLQYEIRPGCRIFLEGIGYLVLGTVTTQDVPVIVGMTVIF